MTALEIKDNDLVLARFIPGDTWNDNLGFYSKDEEFIQVGTWKYNKGKELLAHIHKNAVRTINHTQEVLFIRKGSILVRIYKTDHTFHHELTAKAGDTLIMLNGGHSYTILEDDTQVLEIKNGPYPGAENDRERF